MKYAAVFAGILLMLSVACDDNGPSNASDEIDPRLLGTWKYDYLEWPELQGTIEYKTNGTYFQQWVENTDSGSSTGKYKTSIKEGRLFILDEDDTEWFEYTYWIRSDTLYMKDLSGDTDHFPRVSF